MPTSKAIETPEDMYKLFEQYKAFVKSNPIKKHDYVGKDGDSVDRKLERPLTLCGFENWAYDNASDIHNYFDNAGDRYDEYKAICSRIRRIIRQDQIEGGMAGIYNASITQRLNSLKEQQEIAHVEQPLFEDNEDA